MRKISVVCIMLLSLGMMGCATGTDTLTVDERNAEINEAMESIFDAYEAVRTLQGKKTLQELINEKPVKVAAYMQIVEAAIHSIKLSGADVEFLFSLQTEFEKRFLKKMEVPVVSAPKPIYKI